MQTFAYARVSTVEQVTANQFLEIEAAGYAPEFRFAETISGKVCAAQRPQFAAMLAAIEAAAPPKQLVVSKLDRLGRDASDVLATVKRLGAANCRVVVLALGSLDLTSAAGKMVLGMLACVAEMERDLLVERTQAGLRRAKSEGKALGRRPAATAKQATEVRRRIANGESLRSIARALGLADGTVRNIRDHKAGYESAAT